MGRRGRRAAGRAGDVIAPPLARDGAKSCAGRAARPSDRSMPQHPPSHQGTPPR
ncbi:hypothetical protein BVI2075_30009 [Burkholderia vietnamiensis]|nr:hypothetical protein BVI2075_30009 [Burkholderia vietnamiensis]